MLRHRLLTAFAAHTLHVRVGPWFEATASGWGVAIVPIVLIAALAMVIGFLGGPW